MARYVIINRDGVVDNIIDWDGNTSVWSPSNGSTYIVSNLGSIGDSYSNGIFTPAVAPPTPPAPTKQQRIVSLESKMTLRMIREAMLNSNITNPKTGKTSAQELADIESQIEVLRAQ